MSGISDHEQRMLNLQLQMKQNNEDLKSYLQELDSWEADIKKKEQQIAKDKTPKEDKLPPVRNSLEKKKKKKVKREKQQGKKTKRISSYDYRAWDKFDVDAACESKSSSGSEYETDEEWEVERKKQAAVLEKDKGNEYFKKGDYINAIECYSKGAELDPTNPLLPANRAMAFLKQEKFAAAELDCSVALSLDPLYTKAYLRRGTARMGLKKYLEAKADYERVLQLEPQNKKAKMDLELTEKELSKESLVTHTESTAHTEVGIVKAISKAPHERSKKFLRRIDIEEVGLEDDSERKAAVLKTESSQSQAKKDIMDRDSEMFQRFTAKSPGDIAPATVQNPSSNLTESKEESERLKSSSDNKTCDNEHVTEMTDRLRLDNTQRTVDEGANVVSQKGHSKGPTIPGVETASQASAGSGSGSPGSLSPRELSVPTSSVQFQADFRLLKNNPEKFYQYFKKISPSQYPKLFGQFLDADVLLRILHTIKDFYIRDAVEFFSTLQGLAQVKRFSMVVMFFSKKEKQVLMDIFSHLKGTGAYSEEDVRSLSLKYDIR